MMVEMPFANLWWINGTHPSGLTTAYNNNNNNNNNNNKRANYPLRSGIRRGNTRRL